MTESEPQPAQFDRNSAARPRARCSTGLRANDAAAWDRLVKLYAPLVYHWCRQQGLARDGAWATCSRTCFSRWRPTSAAFARIARATPSAAGCGRSRATRWRIISASGQCSRRPRAGHFGVSADQSRAVARNESISERKPASDALAQRELIQRAPEPDSRGVRGSHVAGLLADGRRECRRHRGRRRTHDVRRGGARGQVPRLAAAARGAGRGVKARRRKRRTALGRCYVCDSSSLQTTREGRGPNPEPTRRALIRTYGAMYRLR